MKTTECKRCCLLVNTIIHSLTIYEKYIVDYQLNKICFSSLTFFVFIYFIFLLKRFDKIRDNKMLLWPF